MGYFGSKATAGLCQALLAMQPAHAVYIESHLGGGCLMQRKAPALRSIGIDLDERALAAFSCPYPVELVHGCAHEYLSSFDYQGDEYIFADPPYLRATRRSGRRYRCDYTDDDHGALLEILRSAPCKVMVAGHPSRLYDTALRGWRRASFQVTTQGVVRTEAVWFNYTLEHPHWSGYAGCSSTDRQRIRRKAQRWAARYRGLAAAERQALLSAMLAAEVQEL